MLTGAKTVLKAAAAAKVKRVIFTSGVVTLYNAVKATSKKPDGSVYGPDDWNTESMVESNAYLYSKTQVTPPPPPPTGLQVLVWLIIAASLENLVLYSVHHCLSVASAIVGSSRSLSL